MPYLGISTLVLKAVMAGEMAGSATTMTSAVAAGGLLRPQADRTTDRVLAEQRALRSAQHLDPIHIEQIEHRAEGVGEIDVIHVDADTLLRRREIEVALADAADGRRHGLAVGGIGWEQRHVRRRLRYVRQIVDSPFGQRIARQRRDGERCFL